MLPAVTGASVGDDHYQIVSQLSTFKVNPNNTTTAIEQITFRATKYDVTATFNVTQATYLSNSAPVLVSEKTAQVNQIASHEHVIAVRGEEDQGRDGNLYNYLVVTVGTDDGERSSDVRIRMDHIGSPAAFGAIEDAWNLLNALGPVT